MTPGRTRRAALAGVAAVAVLVGFVGPAAAHAGSLSGSLRSVAAPFWLVVVAGGGTVAASFLFATLLTDHDTIRAVNDRRLRLPVGPLARLAPLVRWLAVAGLVAVVVAGVVGPRDPLLNLGVLLVWVGWWAGYTMSAYLVADSWPLLNPWRTLASALARGLPAGTARDRSLPATLGAWPSVAGLLALVWLEVVSPVAERPAALAVVVVGYTVVTVAGAAVYGAVWFERVDPVARVFRLYGLVAPVQRRDPTTRPDGEGAGADPAEGSPVGDGGVAVPDADVGREERTGAAAATGGGRGRPTLTLPGTALVRYPGALDRDDVAFVVALLWVTTFDGLVSTPAWNGVVGALSGPVPPLVTHLVTVVVGFGLFLGVYRLAVRYARRAAETYVTPGFLAGWFAPALVPIAAGYHVAHFLGYFLSLAPALAGLLLSPLAPPESVTLVRLPGWFGSLQLAFVVAGHLLAVWVAHARAFDLFPGRLQPIRSQYPFVVVMVAYTAASLWIVAQPFAAPLT